MSRVLIIDNGTSYLQDLQTLFGGYGYSVVKLHDIEIQNIQPDTLVVLSGGHALPVLWHDKFYAKELSLIREYDGPILGICLGFELIAHAYGSHLSLLPRRTHAKRVITINTEGDRYFSNKSFTAFESHKFALRHAHAPLIALGGTKTTVEIIRHATKPIFGVQFHPEVFHTDDGSAAFAALITGLTA